MDASQYKDYVLFMLFIKYITDKYGNSTDFAPPVTIPKGASFNDMLDLRGKPDIGERINTEVIAPLVEANARLARSDFPDFDDPNKLGEGQAKVERLTNLINIFADPRLDFSQNRADHDDILGDAYEYLMRHFATESGKSKGQFYTPAEVSRVIAQVIGISPENTKASTTAYDPTCGSGSLLLKVAAQAGKRITLEGQEKDVTTAGLARMNMILHDFPTANVVSGNTLAAPKFKDGEQLRTYDYVVANPPFSDKTWTTGLTPSSDPFQRFAWGEPPAKQGDYAYLLHIIRSMKGTGKAACILPHGVLFRGNAEATIRQQLVRSGYLKGIIGLPANLFYGTGIPACILVLDKENAAGRKGIFTIDASKGVKKDGPKNRLREQDIHRIVDVFTKQVDVPRYARMVPLAEIADPKNDFSLNIPKYIDSSEPEDIQDIDGHLRGGIPERDLDDSDRLGAYWKVLPSVRGVLFESAGRPGYARLKLPLAEVKPAILGHGEFAAFQEKATKAFAGWRKATTPRLTRFGKDGHPNALIDTIAEDLLAAFRQVPLLDAYDVYQHLMDYWAETMQDDCYLIAADGWVKGAQPREIVQVKNKDNKLVWPESHDYLRGKRRFKSDMVPAPILVARCFAAERDAIEALSNQLATLEQQLDEMREENSGEEGLLTEVIEGEGEEQKITAKAVKARLKEIGNDPLFAEERAALKAYADLLDEQAEAKAKRKAAQEDLDKKIDAKYPKLTEAEIKTLVVDDKWMARLLATVHGELDRVSQTLTGRVRELSKRYATPLPKLTDEVETLAARVDEHLKKMGAVWK
jgi:type I restriction enzyme M protein